MFSNRMVRKGNLKFGPTFGINCLNLQKKDRRELRKRKEFKIRMNYKKERK